MQSVSERKAFAIEIDDLKTLANQNVRGLAAHLLPNGKESFGYWEVGSIAGEKGQSLKINLEGGHVGLWTDFSAPKGSPGYSGNLIQLAAQVNFGGDVGKACAWLMSWLGLDGLDPERLATEKAKAQKIARQNHIDAEEQAKKNRARALSLFVSAVPIGGTPAETYLCERGIDFRAIGMPAPNSLRFHPEVYCREVGRKLPAMLASMVNLEGEHIATHRTWLRADGRDKADLADAKKAMGRFRGGFIPLRKGSQRCSMKGLAPGTRILASEGIENALTVALVKPDDRIIAAVSLSNIGGLVLPDKCPLYIIADRDTGIQQADALAGAVARQEEAGREVFMIWPPEGYKDFNQVIDKRASQNKQGSK